MTEEQQKHLWTIMPDYAKEFARNLYRTSHIEQYETVLDMLFGSQNLKRTKFSIGDNVIVRGNVPRSLTPGALTVFKKFPSVIAHIAEDGEVALKLKKAGCTYGLYIDASTLEKVEDYITETTNKAPETRFSEPLEKDINCVENFKNCMEQLHENFIYALLKFLEQTISNTNNK